MKTLRIIIATLLTSIFLFSTPVHAYYDPLSSIEYNDIMAPLYFEASLSDLNNISGSMGTYVIRNTPSEILDLYMQEGVRIYITQSVPKSERIIDMGAYDGITYGATMSWNGSKRITKISTPVSIYIYSNAFRADTYYHECGHALDDIAEYITGYYKGQKPISNSPEWQSLYSKYGATMASFDISAATNVFRNSNEGFAEAYRLYFSYPQQLQSNCPEVYAFVATQITKYTAYVPALTYDNFDYISYASHNEDLFAVYGFDKKALWEHYINHGQAEGRKGFKIINVKR